MCGSRQLLLITFVLISQSAEGSVGEDNPGLNLIQTSVTLQRKSIREPASAAQHAQIPEELADVADALNAEVEDDFISFAGVSFLQTDAAVTRVQVARPTPAHTLEGLDDEDEMLGLMDAMQDLDL
eukprot:gnl/TRDRNA2_/TRDRNA2_184653_c0_seq1.p1 gnl/TRDRNA2_/TRDRNA2_184653_c0~~gnl/TRDRNA2_/TRDRNA2_184653_c0_seq1.p1  ORF type:complete len:126 (-),score=29.03 gnl/TRDRNA2_/TRDRNA2_184653_c0_seq1:184-561(-)